MLVRDAAGSSGSCTTPLRVNARLPYRQIKSSGGFPHSDVGAFGDNCLRSSVFDVKSEFRPDLSAGLSECRDQPGVSQREEYDKKLQAVGQYDRHAVAGF